MNRFIRMSEHNNLKFTRVELSASYIYVVITEDLNADWAFIRTDKERRMTDLTKGVGMWLGSMTPEEIEDNVQAVLDEIIQIEDGIYEATSILM